MIKICDKSLLEPLIILFKNSTKSSHYPDIWKRSNIIPVNKKNDKQLSYKLPANISFTNLWKNFRKNYFLTKFTAFLFEEKLLNPNQSGFRPSDFCINQLLV